MEDVDGNAAAGILQAIFPFDMTTVECACAACGQLHVLATVAVYRTGMGTTLRCPRCEEVLIRVAEVEGHYWLDMRGVRVLRL